MRYLLAGILLYAIATPATATTFFNGNWLYEQCNPQPSGDCYAYVIAVAESLSKDSGLVLPQFNICLPNGTTAGQLKDVINRDLIGFPERRTGPAFFIAAMALMKAWPCGQ